MPFIFVKDFELCAGCEKKVAHEHTLQMLVSDSTDCSTMDVNRQKQLELNRKKESIQKCIEALVHACECRDAHCCLPSCQKMKRVVRHTKLCKTNTNGGCPICKQLIALCCYHARHCQTTRCPVTFCANIKSKLRQPQSHQRYAFFFFYQHHPFKAHASGILPFLILRLQQADLLRGIATMNIKTAKAPARPPQEKHKLTQQELTVLLHARNCNRRELDDPNNEHNVCPHPHCQATKDVLAHLAGCQMMRNCPVPHCSSFRQTFSHWQNCSRGACETCLPLRAHTSTT